MDRLGRVQDALPEQHDIGAMNQVCRHCSARHFQAERLGRGHFTTCCNNGQVSVTDDRVLREAPELLMGHMVDNSAAARNFRTEIRRYNNALAFASFTTDNANPRQAPGRGPRVFTVHGQVYHKLSNCVTRNDNRPPTYCQLYFIDSAAANRSRLQQQDNRNRILPELLERLDALMRDVNPYAQAFR